MDNPVVFPDACAETGNGFIARLNRFVAPGERNNLEELSVISIKCGRSNGSAPSPWIARRG
jgi:hypothetical protein